MCKTPPCPVLKGGCGLAQQDSAANFHGPDSGERGGADRATGCACTHR
eukprot:gene10295-biopygen15532